MERSSNDRIKVGDIFGRLVVEQIDDDQKFAVCRCECRNFIQYSIEELRAGDITTCGCSPLSITKLPIYSMYTGIRARCYNSFDDDYHTFGGRGIKMCDAWRDNIIVFAFWAEQNGYMPGMQIERRDKNSNFSPENCYWVDADTKRRSRYDNVNLTIFGETKTISDWSRDSRCKVCLHSFYSRLRNGIDPEIALTNMSGNLPRKSDIPLGTSFGEWTTIGETTKIITKNEQYLAVECLCSCGTRQMVKTRLLREGRSLKCKNTIHRVEQTYVMSSTMEQEFTAFGETKSLNQWSKDERCRVPYAILRNRVERKVPVEKALTVERYQRIGK